MIQRVKKSDGFSLIEILVSLVILSFGLLGIAGLQMSSVKGNSFSKNLTQATYVVQERLEFLKNLPIGSASLQAGAHDEGSITRAGISFSRSYTVAINNNLKTINYNVNWNDGINHTISLMTIRSE